MTAVYRVTIIYKENSGQKNILTLRLIHTAYFRVGCTPSCTWRTTDEGLTSHLHRAVEGKFICRQREECQAILYSSQALRMIQLNTINAAVPHLELLIRRFLQGSLGQFSPLNTHSISQPGMSIFKAQ